MTAQTVEPVERVTWQEFRSRFAWRQGEHVTAVGPTGMGKTELLTEILDMRRYVAVFGTKPEDPTLRRLTSRRGGYKLCRTWEDVPGYVAPGAPLRVVVWPKYVEPGDERKQAVEIDHAMRKAFVERNWTLVADELFYMCDALHLARLCNTMWTQGRSIGVSMVAGCQRPRHVPLFAFSQATHIFLWRASDEEDLKRLGGLGAASTKTVKQTVAELPMHDVLYLNTRSGQLLVTNTRS